MYKFAAVVIFTLALALRTINLFSIPSGFTPDEASFAYDAYSILKTGKDQWGRLLPILLESFGDFKLPLLTYITIPFVLMFGLVKEAVRLPNALFGFGAVVFTYLLAGELGKRSDLSAKNTKRLQLISAFLLTISPWHVMMSRGGFEANLTTFFLTSGIYYFLKGLKVKKYFIWSSVFFGLNLFSYHSARLITPLIIVSLFLLYKKELSVIKYKKLLLSFFVFFACLAISFFSLTKGSATRAKDISIANGSVEQAAIERLEAIESGVPFVLAKTLHNKYLVFSERFINNYSQYSSYQFLYINGPAEATYGMVPGNGVSYWILFPLLLGFLISFSNLKDRRQLIVLLIWLVIAPIPAALTTGKGFAANRAVIMLPALQLLYGFGAVALLGLFEKILSKNVRRLVVGTFVVLLLFSFVSFIEVYFFRSTQVISKDMLYGNLETAYILKNLEKEKRQIIVSKKLSEPHIYIAFANSWDPENYRFFSEDWDYRERNINWVDQLPEYRLGKYIFKGISWEEDSGKDAFIVGRPEEFPLNIEPVVIIRYPNGEPAVYVVDPRQTSYASILN